MDEELDRRDNDKHAPSRPEESPRRRGDLRTSRGDDEAQEEEESTAAAAARSEEATAKAHEEGRATTSSAATAAVASDNDDGPGVAAASGDAAAAEAPCDAAAFPQDAPEAEGWAEGEAVGTGVCTATAALSRSDVTGEADHENGELTYEAFVRMRERECLYYARTELRRKAQRERGGGDDGDDASRPLWRSRPFTSEEESDLFEKMKASRSKRWRTEFPKWREKQRRKREGATSKDPWAAAREMRSTGGSVEAVEDGETWEEYERRREAHYWSEAHKKRERQRAKRGWPATPPETVRELLERARVRWRVQYDKARDRTSPDAADIGNDGDDGNKMPRKSRQEDGDDSQRRSRRGRPSREAATLPTVAPPPALSPLDPPYDLESLEPAWYETYRTLRNRKMDSFGNISLVRTYLAGIDRGRKGKDDANLKGWIREHRDMYRFYHKKIGSNPSNPLARKIRAKINQLNEINFVWELKPDVPEDAADDGWTATFKQLVEFVNYRGDCMVPHDTELGRWCREQRAQYAAGKLNRPQIDVLERLGFHWIETDVEDWNKMFVELTTYRSQRGDALVAPPERWGDGGDASWDLAVWADKQRLEYYMLLRAVRARDDRPVRRAGVVASDSAAILSLLDSLEEEFSKRGSGWCKADAEKGRESAGNGDDNWLDHLRNVGLKRKQVSALEGLNFCWDRDVSAKWIGNYRELRAYKAEHGNCMAKCRTRGGWSSKLGEFVARSRHAKDAAICRMIPAKVRLLDELDFEWELPNRPVILKFDQRLEMLKEFKAEHGHCLVPQTHPTLGAFVKRMRKRYAYQKRKTADGKTIVDRPDRQIQALEEIGFTWRIRERVVYPDGSMRRKNGDNPRLSRSSGTTKKPRCEAELPQPLVESGGAPAGPDEGSAASEGEEASIEVVRPLGGAATGFYGGPVAVAQSQTDPTVPVASIRGGSAAFASSAHQNFGAVSDATAGPSSATTADGHYAGGDRSGAVHEMKCQFCSHIIVRATGCLPCGHTFCKRCVRCIRDDMGGLCPVCRTYISDTVSQRHADGIICHAIERGEFSAEEVALFNDRNAFEST